MAKFLVEWTANHSTIVDAADDRGALSVAAEFAGHNSTIDKITGYNCNPVPVEPTQTASEERAAARERNKGLTPAEMCHRMPSAELTQNIRRGGVAAIAEGEFRADEMNRADPSPWWT